MSVLRPGMIVVSRVVVFMAVIVVVMAVVVAVTAQLQNHEAHAGGDQNAAHDRVLRALNRRAKLEPHDHDDRAQDDRDQHVGHPGQARQPGHAGERIAPGAPEHGQRHPVVGEDRVAEPNPGGGGQQRGSVLGHADVRTVIKGRRLAIDTAAGGTTGTWDSFSGCGQGE